MAKPKFWFLSSSLLKPVSPPHPSVSHLLYGTRIRLSICSSQNSQSSLISLFTRSPFFDEINQLLSSSRDYTNLPKSYLIFSFLPYYHYNDLQISIYYHANYLFDLFSNYSPLIDSGLDTLASCFSSVKPGMFPPHDFAFSLPFLECCSHRYLNGLSFFFPLVNFSSETWK